MNMDFPSVPALANLERKLSEMLSDYQRLREENHELRQQLAVRVDEVARLNTRLDSAAQRLELLIERLPES